MTEIEMGPSVAVALHHGAPLSNDGYAMVYIGSTTAITSKSILNHGENYCNCLNNVVCNDETLAVASGLPRTSRKFKENVPHIDQRLIHSIPRHLEASFEDASGAQSVARSCPNIGVVEHETTSQGCNCRSAINTKSHDKNASLYPNGRRKRVKAADLEESQSTVSMMPILELCEIGNPSPCNLSHPAEKTKWRNEARQPEARRRRWAQADPLLDIWKAVSASKYAAAFRRPVALLEEYDGIVRQRMDLSTIRRRLENGLSYTMTELHRDLMLMLANAVVYNRHGSEMFQMAMKLEEHVNKLFKEICSTKQSDRNPSLEETNKLGSRANKHKKKLPLTHDEVYCARRHKDGVTYPSRQIIELQEAPGDLPMAPFKRQRTARKPRLCVSLDALGFQLHDGTAVEVDSSSEEEVAAMLICIRSGQNFSEKDYLAYGSKLVRDKVSSSLARYPKGLDCTSSLKEVVTCRFEQGMEEDNEGKSSYCQNALNTPSLPHGQKIVSDSISDELKDRPISTTVGVERGCKVPVMCSSPDIKTRSSLCEERVFSSYKAVLGNFTHQSQPTMKDGVCEQASWCMTTVNVKHSADVDGQLRDVETTLSVESLQPSHIRDNSGTNHSLCLGVGILGSLHNGRDLELKYDYETPTKDFKSEKLCRGLKHKWQQRWQMQSTAMSEETTTLCRANVASRSVTLSISHCDQPLHQTASNAQRDAMSLEPF